VLEASHAVCQALKGDSNAANVHFDRALAASRAVGHRLHEEWIQRERAAGDKLRRGAAPPRRSLELQDAALLLSDVSTILGAGHSIDLLAHRTATLLHTTGLAARLDLQSESGCEYQAEPTAHCETAADGTFVIRLRGSDRRVTINVRPADSLEELSLLKGLGDVVQAAVHRAAGTQDEDDEDTLWPRTLLPGDEDTIFRSPRMIELLKVAMRLASTQLPVLITGETGTGKEIFARLIHDHSKVRRGPFMPFNASTMSRDMIESQLFGYRRGAFTGANEAFAGVVRAAEGGTLFLDEIGELDLAVQPKFLRFLENGEIHPIGELRPLRVNVRVVAATNADVDGLAAQGLFRSDLLYRLGVTRLSLPPLRERKDEIPALAAHFLTRYSRECDRSGLRLADDFVAALLLYHWPGNIRELGNEIRRAVALAADGDTLTSADLAPRIAEPWNTRPTAVAPQSRFPTVQIRLDQTLPQAIDDLEQQFIDHALAATDGRVTDAARLLGVSRKGLFLKRRRRGLVPAAGDDEPVEA
jgi:DNA-binding NtrC family response regulator